MYIGMFSMNRIMKYEIKRSTINTLELIDSGFDFVVVFLSKAMKMVRIGINDDKTFQWAISVHVDGRFEWINVFGQSAIKCQTHSLAPFSSSIKFAMVIPHSAFAKILFQRNDVNR